jgi:glc operon protein GlcG
MRTINFLCSVLLACAVTLGAQQLSTKKALNLAVAKQIVMASEKEAMKNGLQMFITVVDDGGAIIYLERLDDAQIGSQEVSIEKALTAVKFKRPSKAFEDLVTGGRTALIKLPGALPVEGGIPLMADGKVIGAIGVSGGSSQQDAQVAQAGVAALEALLKKGK